MSTKLNNSASLSEDNFPENNIDQAGKQQSFDGNKNNWTNGLVVLNELDTSDDDDTSSTNSSFTSEISHSKWRRKKSIVAQWPLFGLNNWESVLRCPEV